MSHRANHLYEFGPFVLDPAERILMREGNPVQLQPKVFDTLLVLVQNGGHLIEKGEFIRAVWPEDEFVEEQNLNKNISKLRQALGKGADEVEYIETVTKIGYRFAAEVRVVANGVDELVVNVRTNERLSAGEASPGDGGAITGEAVATTHGFAATPVRRYRRWALATGACAIVAIVAVVYLSFGVGEAESINSVAVLPFANEGSDPQTEYLSDGISESLINSLAQLPNLKVIARSSSFKFKGREVDPAEAARALGVAAVLTGRVSRRDDSLLINVELVDARNNTHVWGKQYHRKGSDLPQVQADISREIAQALRLRLTANEQKQLVKSETVNPVAYELVLKSRFYRQRGGTENHKMAAEYCRQAIEADPAYALAYAELAMEYNGLVEAMILDPKEFTPKVEMLARKAVELDANLPQAHQALGLVHLFAWDWADAERELKRAIELNPNNAPAYISYQTYLLIHGGDEEFLASAKRAREVDPLSRSVTTPSWELMLTHQYDQAVEFVKKSVEANKSNPHMHTFLGYTLISVGRHPESVAPFLEAIRLGDDSPDTQGALAQAYAKSGEPEKARAILRRLETGKEYVSPVGLALIYAALGEREQAFALFERAYSRRDRQLVWLSLEDRYNPDLRSDPRFRDLLRRIGLPDRGQ